jgi:integrase
VVARARKATELRRAATTMEAPKLAGGPHRLRHTFASMFLEAKPEYALR